MVTRASTRFFAVVVAVAAAPLAAACFYDFTFDGAGDGGDGGDAGHDGSILDGGADSDAADAPSDDVPPLPDNFVPPNCKTGCPGGSYCFYDDHQCGRGATGVCMPIPGSGCSQDTAYYCGCGNKIAKSDCELFNQGVDLDVGGCTGAGADHFQCGYEYCNRATSFCQTYKTKAVYACVDWDKQGCDAAAHDCTCAKTSCKTLTCDPGDGGLTLVCSP